MRVDCRQFYLQLMHENITWRKAKTHSQFTISMFIRFIIVNWKIKLNLSEEVGTCVCALCGFLVGIGLNGSAHVWNEAHNSQYFVGCRTVGTSAYNMWIVHVSIEWFNNHLVISVYDSIVVRIYLPRFALSPIQNALIQPRIVRMQ